MTKQEEVGPGFFEGFLTGCFVFAILFFVVLIILVPDYPIGELGLDKDKIASYHVLQYYPEYENCSIEYQHSAEIDCDLQVDGVNIYCEKINDRDGMNVLKNNPTIKLCFDEISLEEILDEYVSEFKQDEFKGERL